MQNQPELLPALWHWRRPAETREVPDGQLQTSLLREGRFWLKITLRDGLSGWDVEGAGTYKWHRGRDAV